MERSMRRVLLWGLLLGLGALVLTELDDIRRYLRLRAM
jgi:uncharacterized protein DUF6893